MVILFFGLSPPNLCIRSRLCRESNVEYVDTQ